MKINFQYFYSQYSQISKIFHLFPKNPCSHLVLHIYNFNYSAPNIYTIKIFNHCNYNYAIETPIASHQIFHCVLVKLKLLTITLINYVKI